MMMFIIYGGKSGVYDVRTTWCSKHSVQASTYLLQCNGLDTTLRWDRFSEEMVKILNS